MCNNSDNALKEYRVYLIETRDKLNESLDKILITLSSGALILSLTFIKDIVGNHEMHYKLLLLFSWIALTLSLASVFFEIFFGLHSYEKTISQVDSGTIYNEKPGGNYSVVSKAFQMQARIMRNFESIRTDWTK